MMILLLSVCSVLAALAAGQQSPTVTIAQGSVVGSASTDGNYFEFHGIPYADSTSGINRFKAPLPPPSFEVPFVANRKDIRCVRALNPGFEGTEDCLVANIFTPSLDTSRRLPVMVWIRGKEFDRVNTPELSFRNFMQNEVIVVSLNYRESILGFLCLGTQIAPGNAGLKDIIAGLKWVKANIAQFGGNPEDITLFGHGSGAAAVDLVTLSPMGTGLVQKAIAQSGNALAPWAVSRDNLEYALQVAEALGHEIENIEQLSEVFTRTSVSALMGVINELDLTDNSLAFSPCIERQELEGVEPFLIKTPAQIIRDGEFLQVPMIFGFVDEEGTIRAEEAVDDDWLERMNKTFTEFIQPDLKFETDAERTAVAQQIREFYFQNNTIDKEHVDKYLKYHGDTMMLVSSIREVRSRMSARPNSPVYLYQFSYSGTLGKPFVGPIDVEFAAHSEELAYMFNNATATEALNRDITVGSILVERWTNFAKTGNPESTTSPVNWLPFSSVWFNYIRMLDDSEQNANDNYEVALVNPHFGTINFWNIIYSSHFLDAQSNWSIKDRNEEETTSTTEAATENPATDDSTTEAATTASPSPDGTTEAPDDEDNSASTAVGYTFLIVSLFSLLSHLHSTQILS
ncbi:hypothetical protein PYW07_006967 [Mythimna separata]|uniref:Carboxylesterase type B domain-containing protein n=1 Tax=Mythimna separata TaxID=271217 RepID=A0AAD7Z129_MYTSE|nr:hypothetical protein PYW07_006967 [Mythimna separata]